MRSRASHEVLHFVVEKKMMRICVFVLQFLDVDEDGNREKGNVTAFCGEHLDFFDGVSHYPSRAQIQRMLFRFILDSVGQFHRNDRRPSTSWTKDLGSFSTWQR